METGRADAAMTLSEQDARALCRRVLHETMQAPTDLADTATDVLVSADLRGIDSHGIRVLPYYLRRWRAGQIDPRQRCTTVRETGGTIHLDAGHGLSHPASQAAMDAAGKRARDCGIGMAVMRNGTHNGAISHYAIAAARKGLISICATACAPHVVPLGGALGLHGTNPFAFALPRGSDDPLVFDAATGYSAAKLRKEAQRQGMLPANRVLDTTGRPTTDPAALADGWILPVGHLGFGLGLLIDALTSGLTGSSAGSCRWSRRWTGRMAAPGSMAIAIDPGATSAGAFAGRIEALCRQVEETPPLDPGQPVRWPGQRGWQEARTRREKGIPFPESEWEKLGAQLAQFGVSTDS